VGEFLHESKTSPGSDRDSPSQGDHGRRMCPFPVLQFVAVQSRFSATIERPSRIRKMEPSISPAGSNVLKGTSVTHRKIVSLISFPVAHTNRDIRPGSIVSGFGAFVFSGICRVRIPGRAGSRGIRSGWRSLYIAGRRCRSCWCRSRRR